MSEGKSSSTPSGGDADVNQLNSPAERGSTGWFPQPRKHGATKDPQSVSTGSFQPPPEERR